MSSSSCTVCGTWYAGVGIGWRDICPDCWRRNFAGNPLEEPTAREALDAYVDAAHQCTPRQVEAMRRMQARWLEDTA